MVIYMDILHSSTIKPKTYFNTYMSIGNIANAYRLNSFPDSYCMVTSSLEDLNALATENIQILETQNRRVVLTDGCSRFYIH